MYSHVVIVTRNARLRDRIGMLRSTDQQFVYFTESCQANEGSEFKNPAPMYMCESQQFAEMCAQAVCEQNPGYTVYIASVTDILTSVAPRKVEIKRSKVSAKGVLPE